MSGTAVIILGIDGEGSLKNYRVMQVSYKETNGNYTWDFKCRIMSEAMLGQTLSKANCLNAKLDTDKNGKLVIKGSAGSLDRFKDKPYVIISQIQNEDGKTLGYKVASYEGRVKDITIRELAAYGMRANKEGKIPVQNAIFVPADAAGKMPYYKSYPDHPFFIEKRVVGKKEQVRRAQTSANEKTLSKLDEIYTPEQIAELKAGKASGVDIRIFANPALSAKQMHVLRTGLEQKINIKPFAFPEFSPTLMELYIDDLSVGLDIRRYLNPKYTAEQASQLSLANELGINIAKIANPKIPANEMAEVIERLKSKLWKEHTVNVDVSWK